MANKSSSEQAAMILSHLEERLAGCARSLGALKRKAFAAVQSDVARIIDGKPVEWVKPEAAPEDVEIEEEE